MLIIIENIVVRLNYILPKSYFVYLSSNVTEIEDRAFKM
jgi:hypothetical protein